MGMFESAVVWDRATARPVTMSRNLYAGSIALFVLAGLVFAGLFSRVSAGWVFTNGWLQLGFVLGVVIVSLIGTKIYQDSDNPVFSLLGYALIAGPFGLLLGPFLAQYTDASTLRVFGATSLIVLVLGVVGALIPQSLEGWSVWLLGGLFLLLIGYFVIPIVGVFGIAIGGALTLLDWIGVVIFSFLAVFYMNRAMRLPPTLDNAIDMAAAMFVVFVNIAIRLLSIYGQRSD